MTNVGLNDSIKATLGADAISVLPPTLSKVNLLCVHFCKKLTQLEVACHVGVFGQVVSD